MTHLLTAVKAALDAVVPQGCRALVAVSGGPDSTALLFLVAEVRPDLGLAVGHVRHGLRDDALDAEVAARHAAALGVPFCERKVAVDARAPEGLEAAARAARYEALATIARAAGAVWLVVGHTADDQAETVLLNVARGSGLRGLGGMSPVRDLGGITVVRPLLGLERARVRAFVAERGLCTVADPTNADVERRRARARHETIPRLAALTGHPDGTDGLVRALVRLAALARDDADALDALAEAEAGRLVVSWGPVQTVPMHALAALPRALAGRVVRRMLAKARTGGGSGGATSRERIDFDGLDAESVWAVLALRPGQAVHVAGGAWVTAGGGWLAAAPPGLRELPERPLALPGATLIPELGAVLLAGAAAETADVALRPPGATGPLRATVPHATPLVVRARRPGDRMGARRLSDLLSVVPRAARPLVPVVARGDDVLWVPGIAAAEGTEGVPMRLVPAAVPAAPID
ncbi:MAG: tRNA lysidine(34) synthetase TilS [Egibacteraceae bacterium]